MNTSSDKNLPDLPLSFDNDQTVETEKLFTSLSSLALVAACTLSRVNSLNTRQFEYLLTWWLINYYKNDRNAKYNWSAKSWPFKMKRNLAPVETAVVDMTTVHFAWTYPNPLLLC